MRMLNRNPKRLSAEVFSSAQKQPKQNASSQNREENGSTTLRNTREKPLLAGYKGSKHGNMSKFKWLITNASLRHGNEAKNRKLLLFYLFIARTALDSSKFD